MSTFKFNKVEFYIGHYDRTLTFSHKKPRNEFTLVTLERATIPDVTSYLCIDGRVIVHQGKDVVVYEFILDASNSGTANKVCSESVLEHVVAFTLKEKFYTDCDSSCKIQPSGHYYEIHHQIDIGQPDFDLIVSQKNGGTEISRLLKK